MSSFRDMNGKSWFVTINTNTIRRVRNALDINLLAIFDGQLLERLTHNYVDLVNVLYVCCKPEADKAGITDEQFGEALGGDSLGEAVEAFLEALINYFPGQEREALKKAAQKARSIEKMVFSSAIKTLEGDSLDKMVEKELRKITDSFSKSPDTSVLTSENTP